MAALDHLADSVAPGDARFKFRLISKEALERRRKSATKRLTSEEGDRLARLVKVFSFALDIYKVPERARVFSGPPASDAGRESAAGPRAGDQSGRGSGHQSARPRRLWQGPVTGGADPPDSNGLSHRWRRWCPPDFGRWNVLASPIIYTSEHYSTAMLEKLVNANSVLPPQPASCPHHHRQCHQPRILPDCCASGMGRKG